MKFKDIALYWTAKGVDGFRYDMAEMVPYEFWSYMNSAIKMANPDSFLMAEVYNPREYRNYIHLGKMDYLYDKVETYDKLKDVIQGRSWPDEISGIQYNMMDIEHHMLHFLDNHDEQRLASPEFAGSGERGKPLMVVSTTLSSSPTMIYFGQEVGEPGKEDAGFGTHSRTSIFDYIGVPHHQRWMNNGKFDGGQLSSSEKELRDFYKRLLNFSLKSSALMGGYQEIQGANRNIVQGYDKDLYTFARWSKEEQLIVVANFSSTIASNYEMRVPADLLEKWNIKDGTYTLVDQLYGKYKTELKVINGEGRASIAIAPSESFILKLQ